MSRTQYLRDIQERLRRRREALRAALAGDQTLLHTLVDDGVGDEIDAAVVSEQAELRSQLAQVESRELAQIDRALEKIRGGQYGRCESCERPIPAMRLKYLPYAADCVSCARRAERRGALAGGASASGGSYRPVNRIAALATPETESADEEAELEVG
jgi:DnaK suppressor protein